MKDEEEITEPAPLRKSIDICRFAGAGGDCSLGDSSWGVTFTTEAKMESSFKTVDLNDVIHNMQPGDTAVLTVALQNKNSSSTDWYMTKYDLSAVWRIRRRRLQAARTPTS